MGRREDSVWGVLMVVQVSLNLEMYLLNVLNFGLFTHHSRQDLSQVCPQLIAFPFILFSRPLFLLFLFAV